MHSYDMSISPADECVRSLGLLMKFVNGFARDSNFDVVLLSHESNDGPLLNSPHMSSPTRKAHLAFS